MRFIYRYELLATADETEYQNILDALRSEGIPYKNEIAHERYVAPHSVVAPGRQIMGRSTSPMQDKVGSTKIYKIYIKPVDKERAVRALNAE